MNYKLECHRGGWAQMKRIGQPIIFEGLDFPDFKTMYQENFKIMHQKNKGGQMKKSLILASVVAFVAALSLGATVSFADDLLPGAYTQQDQSVMGVGRTMMEIGAADRALTNAVNLASGAGRSRSTSSGSGVDYQFGSSQSDQSWKAARTVEEAEVYGLVPGDCQGDNSTDAYRKQMNQNRDGYVQEKMIPNSICGDDHATIKIGETK